MDNLLYSRATSIKREGFHSVLEAQPVWFIGFVVLLALVPLPFGSNRPWAGDVFGLVVGVLLALCARDLFRGGNLWFAGAPWRRIGFSAGAVFAVLLWGFIQTTSLWAVHPLWIRTAQVLDTPLAGAISLTPDRFSEVALRIGAYAACFLLAFFGGRDAVRAKLLLKMLCVIAASYAFYGLLVQSSGLEIVLWYPKWAYFGVLTSTFINKNSYATYAGLGLLCCFGMLWLHVKERSSLRLSIDASALFHAALCLVVFGALILTASRAGITSAFAGCFAFLIALAVNRKWTGKKRWIILLPAIAFALGLASFGADMFLDRMDPKMLRDDSMLRVNAYETIARTLADNPWVGFGLGSFDSAFHLYRNAEIQEWFEHAHNDYLELAVELGTPMAVLYLAAIGVMISCCVVGVARRRKQEIYGVIAVGASVLVGMHSLVDFSMKIPAVAASYAALLGLGVAQSWSSRDVSGDL